MSNETKKPVLLNANVKTAKITQSGNEELGLKEKNLYYLVIETEQGKMQINVGEKTYESVQKLTPNADKALKAQIAPDKTEDALKAQIAPDKTEDALKHALKR